MLQQAHNSMSTKQTNKKNFYANYSEVTRTH